MQKHSLCYLGEDWRDWRLKLSTVNFKMSSTIQYFQKLIKTTNVVFSSRHFSTKQTQFGCQLRVKALWCFWEVCPSQLISGSEILCFILRVCVGWVCVLFSLVCVRWHTGKQTLIPRSSLQKYICKCLHSACISEPTSYRSYGAIQQFYICESSPDNASSSSHFMFSDFCVSKDFSGLTLIWHYCHVVHFVSFYHTEQNCLILQTISCKIGFIKVYNSLDFMADKQ